MVTGIWLYRPFMENPGRTGTMLGVGGIVGILALIVGAALVGRTVAKATALAEQAQRTTDASARATIMKQVAGCASAA